MNILTTLEQLYATRSDEIEHWFGVKRAEALPFFYTSVDLRHSGLRLAPVDTNLYPAGFNNLSHAARTRASRYVSHLLSERLPDAKRVIIVPENHTRNLGYLENLAVLQDILTGAGLEARIGNLGAEESVTLTTMTGREITQYPLAVENRKLITRDGFDAELVILNNDLTSGIHPLLNDLQQPVWPPAALGWFVRRKSTHFTHYQKLAEDFGNTFDLDPWLISPAFYHSGMIDFKERTGLESLAGSIDKLLETARRKHAQYGISDEPYVFVKADSGTYGMGIMTVKSGAEMLELNKKERNKMQVVKEGSKVTEVIIQEGIPTMDVVAGKPAEPMVYMIDGLPVGGMYRVNGERDSTNNLNAAGMEFVGMCDEAETAGPNRASVKECDFRAFGLIAAIAALACAREDYGLAANI